MDEYQRLIELPPFEKFDLLLVILFSILAGIISETLSYFLLYNRGDYRTKHNEAVQIYEQIFLCISRQFPYHVELNVKHDTLGKKGKNEKVTDQEELELKFLRKLNEIRDLRYLSTLITGVTFMTLMPVLMSLFEATPVGKLPFIPFKFMLYFTRSDLPGSDLTDVSPAFIYTIVIMLAKNNIKSYLGFAQPGGTLGELILKTKLREKGIEV